MRLRIKRSSPFKSVEMKLVLWLRSNPILNLDVSKFSFCTAKITPSYKKSSAFAANDRNVFTYPAILTCCLNHGRRRYLLLMITSWSTRGSDRRLHLSHSIETRCCCAFRRHSFRVIFVCQNHPRARVQYLVRCIGSAILQPRGFDRTGKGQYHCSFAVGAQAFFV